MGPVVSRQDVQNMINACQNRLLERMASKQDVQLINDMIKSLINLHQQNQQILRQAEYQRTQLTRRAIALEARLTQIEQEMRGYKDVLNRIASTQTQSPKIVLSAPEGSGQMRQYVYRPA